MYSTKINDIAEKIGVNIPTILLPNEEISLEKWAVVACDQYTSEPEYWQETENIVGDSHSTLNLIFPEIYLENEGKKERMQKINKTMQRYMDEHILVPQKPGFIYVERETSRKKTRKGLILAVDLEKYDYSRGSQSLIRATEGTVLDRLPPRIKIRENAPIELPHIMLLIDDPLKTVIEPLNDIKGSLEVVYDFDLMMNGGHIKGYKVEKEEHISSVLQALEKLAEPEVFYTKYNVGKDKGVLLFAAGDGNHSLATAKACWDKIKENLPPEEASDHPARYALVEVVNIHDDGLDFHPIHRVVFNADPESFLKEAVNYYNSNGQDASYEIYSNGNDRANINDNKKQHIINFVYDKTEGALIVKNPVCTLEVGTLQTFLDYMLKDNSKIKVDYIHGKDVVYKLGTQKGNIGFYLPSINKSDLFKTVILEDALPKKTFSMGEAEEKRYYLECRKISR